MAKQEDNTSGVVLGMDLGGTKLSGALFFSTGEIRYRTGILHGSKGGAKTGSQVVKQIQELESIASENSYRIDAVAICVPGISNPFDRVVWAPNIPGWEAYPLHREIKESLRNPSIPIAIESDRNCYIMGEIWKGNARDCKNAIFMAVGTGIGIGIVANGQIINGSNGIAGAIGWMALDRPYVDKYDPCGQFEYHASGPGISRSAELLLSQGTKSVFLSAGRISARDVFDAYDKKDEVAVQVLEKCIGYWGMAVANLVSLFNPEKIIFGGGVFGPALQFLDKIHEEARKWAQPISIQKVKLEASSLKGDAGLYGAGYMAIRNKTMF